MSQSDMPQFSIVVTCKNRLHHLRQTFPRMLEQENAEVVLVDYGCTQGTAQWARANRAGKDQLTVLEIKDDPVFCLSRARNLGAKSAAGRFLCFIDADIILEKDLCAWASANADEAGFYLHEKTDANDQAHPETVGCCIVPKAAFDRIGGYDEAFRGWGGEDRDLYERLQFAGLSERSFPAGYITPIRHGDEERQLGAGSGGALNKRAAVFVCGMYRTVKYDVTRLTGIEPDLQERRKIMAYIQKAYLGAYELGKRTAALQFAVPCKGDRKRLAMFERRLSYRLLI